MHIRKFESRDLEAIVNIVKATKVFRDDEVNVARELLEIAANNPEQKDYIIYVAENSHNTILGYYCVGHTPLTKSTFDLYWIAVHPVHHRTGIGHKLLEHCETFVRNEGGTLIMVETSSLPKYERTRQFYLRHHYQQAARIPNYYATGDDLIVYTKYL